MAHKIQPVRPEDFDAEALKQAAEEGRLFIVPSPRSLSITLKNNARQVLCYVAPLRMYTKSTYRAQHRDLWKAIVNHPDFFQRFTIQKGKNEGSMNKYFIMSIVDCLKNLGFYQEVTSLQLHRILEQTDTRNKYYNNMGQYALERSDVRILRELLEKGI